jgi:hypothetical protein
MRETPGVDIVTRLYDLADLPYLNQLLFSVLGQVDAGPMRLHVMLQRFSFTEVQAVRGATAGVRRLHGGTSMTLHNWDYPAPFDLRVPLLNWGLEAAQGRYVLCLDIHDQLYSHACAALLARLCGTSSALALGGAALQPVWWWGDVVIPVPDRFSEPLPIPIFMIDRNRLAAGDCVFANGEDFSETGAFAQRISASYAVDATCRNAILAVRRDPLTSLDLELPTKAD